MWFDDWTKEDLAYKLEKFERKIEELKEKNRNLEIELGIANFKIESELKPRIEEEHRAYDRWVTNPEMLKGEQTDEQ